MKEIIIYLIAACSSLLILGYSVHMFVGDLVTPQTEMILIIAACIVGVIIMGYMAWDVYKRRRQQR